MNPRVRRLVVSGVLSGLILIVVVAAAWNWLRWRPRSRKPHAQGWL